MGPTGDGIKDSRGRRGIALLTIAVLSVPLPAFAANLPINPGASFDNGRLIVLSALAAGAVALAIAASLWALAEQRSAQRMRRALKGAGARTKAAVGERDALLGAGREALVVWGRDGSGPFSYGGGDALLDSCLKGSEALALSQAIDALSDKGVSFQLDVQDAHGRNLVARGRAVGSMAAVWLEEPAVAAATADFRAILDALPIPVWLRDKALALTWANHAFLSATAATDLDAARRDQVALDKSERELAASARSQNLMVETKRFAVVGGQRRAITFTEIPLGESLLNQQDSCRGRVRIAIVVKK